MKEYEKLELEIKTFYTPDIMTTSNPGDFEDGGFGEDDE